MQPENAVTLEQILKARDDRALKQKKLIAGYGLPLISFTVNMPGSQKSSELSLRIFQEGYNELLKALKDAGKQIIYQEAKDSMTGSEAYIAVDMDTYELKLITISIEDRHPLGRLWDFDVVGHDGRPVSREELGHPGRCCLICEKDAHSCARSRAHTLDELLEKIRSIADGFFGDT